MRIKLVILSIITLLQIETFSQVNNNLIVKSADSIHFFIFVNDILQNNSPYYNIKLTGFDQSSMKMKIYIPDSSKQIIEKSIYFEETLRETSAELIPSAEGFKFRYTGEVPIGVNPVDTNQLIIPYHDTPLILDSIYRIDSTYLNDSILNPSSQTLTYKGKTGCNKPLDNSDLLIESIENELFSSKKLELAKKGLTNHCYLVNDIKKIISLFEFDDQKLELSMMSFLCTYDLENFSKLKELLLLNSSLKTFEKFLNENNQLDKN